MPENINNLKAELENLRTEFKEFVELYKRKEKTFEEIVKITGTLRLGGGRASQDVNGTIQPSLEIYDDPGIDSSKRGAAFAVTTFNKDVVGGEQISVAMVSQKINKPNANTQGIQATDLNLAEIFLAHGSNDETNYNSFFAGARTPIVIATGKIINGGTVLTDLSQNFKINELAGSRLWLITAAGGEDYLIASNTANTITITGGTWVADSNEYTYQVYRTVFLGGANAPWRRLFVGDEIRLGYGASGGTTVRWIKWGTGSPEGEVTAGIGSIYLRTDGGAGTSLYVKESGVGNLGWIGK